jgi:glycerol-3-phosphate dehydrogenase (NAD(P)+)
LAENPEIPAPYSSIGVLGAGAWGTALALTAAKITRRVHIWARDSAIADRINSTRENPAYLPSVALPASITATTDLDSATSAAALLVVVPAQSVRDVLMKLARVTRAKPIVLCAKGIEKTSGLLLTEVLQEILPDTNGSILSGPSFARDVAQGLPTAITIAGQRETVARLQATLGSETFRPYASDDPKGVALGGAAKNVYAIAAGIADGLGLGESARAALLARSFAELMRLGEALGTRPETLMGLSGLGDLVLTATSLTSRNHAFGLALGRGASPADLSRNPRPLAEGVDTAPALVKRARAVGIELPIAEAVAAILTGSLGARAAIVRLMSRPLTSE